MNWKIHENVAKIDVKRKTIKLSKISKFMNAKMNKNWNEFFANVNSSEDDQWSLIKYTPYQRVYGYTNIPSIGNEE